MSQTFGMEAHGSTAGSAAVAGEGHEPPPARYLVLIRSASDGRRAAKVLLDDHTFVAEFDSSAPEVQLMCSGLQPQMSAAEPRWDRALAGHSDAERRAAEVYELGV